MAKIDWGALGLETKQQAIDRHAELCRRMERTEISYPTLHVVRACGQDFRCGRDGCPLCLRRFRKQFVRALDRLALWTEGAWSRISVIPSKALVLSEDLHTFNLDLATEAVNRRLARSKLGGHVFIGGWDISSNWFANEPVGNQLQIYGLLSRKHDEDLNDLLYQALAPDPRAHRPVMSKPVDPDKFLSGATYAHKALFSRRSGYDEPDRLRRDGRPRKNAKDLPLRPHESLEITSWLAAYPVGARLILRGVKRTNPPGSELRLAVI